MPSALGLTSNCKEAGKMPLDPHQTHGARAGDVSDSRDSTQWVCRVMDISLRVHGGTSPTRWHVTWSNEIATAGRRAQQCWRQCEKGTETLRRASGVARMHTQHQERRGQQGRSQNMHTQECLPACLPGFYANNSGKWRRG